MQAMQFLRGVRLGDREKVSMLKLDIYQQIS